MPFNKGDFTQQGVAGHVNANLRLNEKRLVNIDLTSNEEAEGCTITGTVTDLLNDKVYNIGSGGGGGDLPVGKCTITIVNSAESTMNIDFADSATPIFINGDNFIADNNMLWYCSAYLSETNPTVLTPGQSITLDCYYGGNLIEPHLALTMALSAGSQYSGTFSNITNMTEISTSDEHSYLVTDYSADSACTLTVVHTI